MLKCSNSMEKAHILLELNNIDKQNLFNELSFHIYSEEIDMAITSLKPGEAAGPNNIPSEVIRESSPMLFSPFLLPIIRKL